MEIVAERLQWIRKKERYSQKDVAERLGITPGALQKIESGERMPKVDTLKKLCEYYRVKTDFILGLSNLHGEVEDLFFEFFQLRNTEKEMMKELLDLVFEQQKAIVHIEENNISKKSAEFIEEFIKTREEKIRRNLYLTKNRMEEVIEEYIDLLIEIPKSKPSKDAVIKLLAPLDFNMKKKGLLYHVQLSTGEGTTYNIGTFSDEDSAYEYMEDIEERLAAK